MVDLNGIKNETKRNHAEKVLNGHELECYEDLNLDYVNEFCAQRNLKMTLQVLLFPDSTPTGLIRCSLCDGAFRSRNGHPWFNGSDRNRYVIKKQLIDNHLKYYHTSKEEKKRARQAAASSSLTLDNTILGGDILETFNNVLTERDDLLQILKENNVPAPSKGIPGLIIQAYLVLSRLFDLDLLEPLSDRGVDGFYQNSIETPSNTDIQVVETEVKLEPVASDTEVFTETVRFSDESDDDEECDDEGGGEEEEHFDLDSDFLSEDEFFAPSKKKRRKYTNHNYDEKLKSVTSEQTSALQAAFDACVCLTRSVEKELIESTKLEGGLISAWYRAKRKSLSPEQKESARNEMIKLRAKETVQCPQCDKTVTKAYLKLHIQRVHEGGVAGKSRTSPKTPKARKPKPTFPCPQCDRILKTKSSLKNHIKVVHDDQTVTCDQCGKTVRNNEALKHHMRMYHVEKRFVCDICDFRATHQCKLDLHRLKHFPNLMPFKCDFCSYATTEKRNLEAHVRKHTGEF